MHLPNALETRKDIAANFSLRVDHCPRMEETHDEDEGITNRRRSHLHDLDIVEEKLPQESDEEKGRVLCFSPSLWNIIKMGLCFHFIIVAFVATQVSVFPSDSI